MATVNLTPALQAEYTALFDSCQVRPERAKEIDDTVTKIEKARARYASVGDPLKIPWYLIGVIHCLETSINFDRHLHNGDKLTARTKQVPAGRPKTGNPPFTWEESATDALMLKNLHTWTDWTVPGLLYQLERYNGFGYRQHHPEVRSPYLWSFSNHYTSGKYVADGTFSSTAKSAQCGAATILRRMAERGIISFSATGTPVDGNGTTTETAPLVRYAPNKFSAVAEELQRGLNKLPGVFLKVDGFAGKGTSDAVKKVLGFYLAGDPRA
jgi:lysozyme family protein